MTPKEKAIELAEKMVLEFPRQENTNANVSFIAKNCALIAVDEILKCVNNPDEYYLMEYSIFYWKEVKQEIEAL
jgi:hypothetical protein